MAMRFVLMTLGVALFAPAAPVVAQSLTLAQLADRCSGRVDDDIERSLDGHSLSSLTPELRDELRTKFRRFAELDCASYLSGSLDQIILFFDTKGVLEEAKLICIPPSYYERPTALRELLTYKLQNLSKKELVADGSRTAKFWIATTMMRIFRCPRSDAAADSTDSTPPSKK